MSLQRMFRRKGQQPQPPKAQPVPEAVAEIVAHARALMKIDDEAVRDEALRIVYQGKTPDEIALALIGLELARGHLSDDLAAVNSMRERLGKLSEQKRPVFA